MITLMSALPNSLLPQKPGEQVLTYGIEESDVKFMLETQDWVSAIGHDSTAALFSKRLGLPIKANRVQVSLSGILVVGLFVPPYRLPEGQLWTEEEILAMPINWIGVKKV